MSILVKEDYVNPDIPLWAKNGGGGCILLNSMPEESYNNFEDYSAETFVTVLTATNNQPVSGKVHVTVNMNIDGNGGNNNYTIPTIVSLNGEPFFYSENPRASQYTNTSYNFNISIPYVANSVDTYEYKFLVQTSTDVRMWTSCSFVFYPNP